MTAAAREQWLRDNTQRVLCTPGMMHNGRLLGFDEPERIGWDEVQRHAERDGLVALPLLPVAAAEQLEARFGPGWHAYRWSVFLGEVDIMRPVCKEIVEGSVLEPGWWRGVFEDDPDDAVLEEVAALNRAIGVTPHPAWYLKGEAVPSITTLLRNDRGQLVGSATAQARHHPQGAWAGVIFVGLVSVHPEQRGRGLGRLLNAFTILEALVRLPGYRVNENVAADNAPSWAMVRRCGLEERPELATVILSREVTRFTR